MFMGLCAAAFLPMFTYGIFSKRPSALAAKLSLVVGAAVWFFWTAFVHIKESDPLGLCEWIFGKPRAARDALAGHRPVDHRHAVGNIGPGGGMVSGPCPKGGSRPGRRTGVKHFPFFFSFPTVKDISRYVRHATRPYVDNTALHRRPSHRRMTLSPYYRSADGGRHSFRSLRSPRRSWPVPYRP